MPRIVFFVLIILSLGNLTASADTLQDALAQAVEDFQAGNKQAALEACVALAHQHPNDPRAHSVLGQLQWYAGLRDEAEASFLRTLEIDPAHQEARIRLKRMNFVPRDFRPPTQLVTDTFVLRPITAADAESDHAALMSSVAHLQGTFGPGDTWPQGVTLEENREVLGWHEQEFAERTGFVYTVRSRNGDRCVGCVYFYPSRRDDFQADALFWVTADAEGRGWDPLLDHDVRSWLETTWPFTSVAFPGRDMTWEEYLDTSG